MPGVSSGDASPRSHAPHDHAHGHHGGGHDHDHRHAAREAGETRLAILLALVVAYIGVEVAGGLWGNSLALLADAGHMVSDAAALGITLWAVRIARRPTTPERTFGWHRAEILAAAVNGAALLAIAGGILWEAAERWREPATTSGALVLAIATGGLIVNLVGLALLHAGREASINLRGAWLHVLSDALGSAGAMIAGACAWAFGWRWVDPLASALIALLVLRSAWRLLNDAVDVLMEGAPTHLDTRDIRAALAETPGVLSVHDLHVWTITSDLVAMSGHVVVAPEIDACDERTRLLHALTTMLRSRFGIEHATIQIEPPGFDAHAELHP